MALGDSYATPVEFKAYIPVENLDPLITDSLSAASREIERHCGRQFNRTEDATARVYEINADGIVITDDFYSASGLMVKVDADGDGVFEQTLTPSDYRLEPLNGMVDGQPRPYYRLCPMPGSRFPSYRFAAVEVTAQWGWPTVPLAVKQACIGLANENLKVIREAPFGVAGTDAFGLVRVRDNQRIRTMLQPYRRYDRAVA